MSECGAKTRAGGTCKRKPMDNGRCHYHGGKSPGAPKNNQYAVKHGIYSSVLDDEEKELWDDVRVGNLEHEVRLIKLQLVRAVKYNKDNPTDPRHDIVERLMRTVANLEKTHADINTGAEEGIDWEKVGEQFAAFAEKMGTTNSPPGTD